MPKHLIAFLLAAFAILFASAAKSAEPAAVKTKSAKLIAPVKEKALSLSVDLYASSNRLDTATSGADRALNAELLFKYQLNEQSHVFIKQDFSYSNVGISNLEASNTALGSGLTIFKLSDQTSITPTLRVILPSNEEDRNKDGLKSAVAVKLALTTETTTLLPISYSFSTEALKNFHKFENNADLEANLSYRLRTIAALEISLSKNLTFSLAGLYDSGRTYQEALKTGFLLAQEASYSFTDTTAAFIAHENSGDARAANGTNSNIVIADKYSSIFSIGFRTKF